MNNINGVSSNLTASSILKNTSAQAPKDESANIDTKDSLVKSSDNQELKKADFLKMTPESKKGAIIGASVGGVVGGVVGGITAYNMSMNEVRANNDIQSVSLDWQEPKMQTENLGKIPADYYQPNSFIGLFTGNGHQSVYRDNPVMQGGQPVMVDKSQTFSDYGTPVVSWNNNNVVKKELNGYQEYTRADVTTYERYEGTTSDGRPIYSTYEEVNGFHHSFSPNIKNLTVGTYQTPKVKFETGVNVGLNTTLGVLAGAGLGAAAGAFTGALISNAMNK